LKLPSDFETTPYTDLIPLIDQTKHIDKTGPSGTDYQIDIYGLSDNESKGHLRIVGAV